MELKCDHCGKIFERKRIRKEYKKNFCSKECQTKGQKDGLSDYRRMHTKATQRAARDSIEFDLSLEDVKCLWCSQDGRCNLSGEPLRISGTAWEKQHGCTTASLDRIRSSGGYTPDNVQIIHKDVNQMKWNMDQDMFIRWCHRVAAHNPIPFDYPATIVDNGLASNEPPF